LPVTSRVITATINLFKQIKLRRSPQLDHHAVIT
jgi:hypothetical protein